MKNPIIIGEKKFKHKKDALTHYKTILGYYKFGESLNDEHYSDLLDLIDYKYSFFDENESDNDDEVTNNNEVEEDLEIIDIKIGKV